MIDHGDRLREAFETHEHLSPDPAAVYARVQELARTYRRRRRGAQVAGGAVLGAGLIAGAIHVPGLLPAAAHHPGAGLAPAAAPATVSARPSPPPPSFPPVPAEMDRLWKAYFAAGYGYQEAVQLAHLWHMTGDVGLVKAEAGRRLLAGEKLPVEPTPVGTTPPENPRDTARVDAFFAAGYNYDDAVTLAQLWKTVDPYHAKIEGGKRLLAGETLPIRP